MPAAAVIPAPIAYIKVVAVKTFVVELVFRTGSYQTPVFWSGNLSYLALAIVLAKVRGRIIGVFVLVAFT